MTQAYVARRGEKSYGIHFIDQHGQLVFRLLLTKQDGQFDPSELEAYRQDWQTLTGKQ